MREVRTKESMSIRVNEVSVSAKKISKVSNRLNVSSRKLKDTEISLSDRNYPVEGKIF